MLVIFVLVSAVVEVLFRAEMVWRGVALSAAILAVLLPWRRTHPLMVLLITFETMMVLELIAHLNAIEWPGLVTYAYILLLPYALVRWASGRDILIGLGVAVLSYGVVKSFDMPRLADNIAGGLVFLFPATLGAAVRFRTAAAARELERFKLLEREQLARELHDTVAHYVSAIAIQAQAGLAMVDRQPQAAKTALETIESSSRQTMTELRAMVRTLRRDDDADWQPLQGVEDIPSLAGWAVNGVHIGTSIQGDLDDLSPGVSKALYRLAQESVTNALRHARQASRIDVSVLGQGNSVRITIEDNGADPGSRPGTGYGLIGMSERVSLLGGTFAAGWYPGVGWRVDAELPKQEAPR